MKIIISRELLLKSLNNVSRVFASKSILPVFSNFKFSLRRDKLEILASNSDTTIVDSIDTVDEYGNKNFEFQTTGECLVPYRVLEIIRKLSGAQISIDCIDDSILGIDDGNSSFKVNTMRAKEYPDISLALSGDSVEVNAKEFAKSVSQVAFASSNKDTTNILTGVNIKTEQRNLILTATDGARLSRKVVSIASQKEFNSTIPTKILTDVARMCENADSIVIGFDKNKCYFKINSMVIFTTVLAGEYPNLAGLLTPRYTIDLNASAKEIVSALERVSLLFIDKQTSAKFKVTQGEFKITSKSQEFGSVVENINNYQFDDRVFEIIVDCDYILQAIKALGKENVKFKFTGETKPLHVVSDDEPNLVQIITPLRINN